MADEEDQTEEDQADDAADDAGGDGEEGGEGEGDEDSEGGGGGKKDLKKLVLMIGVPILILVGIGAGLYFSGFFAKEIEYQKDEHGEYILDDHGEKIPVVEEEHGDDHGKGDKKGKKDKKGKDDHGKKDDGHGKDGKGGKGGDSQFLEIPPMIVNLTSADGNPRYLRLTVQLELVDPSQAGEVQAVMPRVIDQFQTYLRELRVKDLRGSAGIYRLQMELLWRVNQAAAPVEIKDVLFQEILIQ